MDYYWFAVISAALFLFSLTLLRDRSLPARTRLFRSAMILSWLLLLTAYWTADRFTGRGIDESVIYHLRVGLTGAGFREYIYLMMSASALVALAIWLSIRFYRKSSPSGRACSRRRAALALMLMSVAVVANPAVISFGQIFATQDFEGFDRYYHNPRIINRPVQQRSVVVVYLESLERTYLDHTLFPGLLPGLQALEQEALTFTEIKQVTGTGWTIAGMVGSQCGLPLLSPSEGNSMAVFSDFLPRAVCVGDLLRQQSYYLSYMGGANTEFAGKGAFYRSHGFQEVQGLHELTDPEQPDYRSGWGVFDDTLFDRALKKHAELVRERQPFGLFLLTLDTHHPNGHSSASCEGLVYGDGQNPMLNSVHCADRLVTEFVKNVRQQDPDTLVVLLSDHLAMRNTASNLLTQRERRNLFMVLGGEHAGVNERVASTLDVGPTLMQLLGYEMPKLGLGRSLLTERKTLAHYEDVNERLRSWRGAFSRFWGYAGVSSVQLDGQARTLRLGGDLVDFPVLIDFDTTGSVREVVLDYHGGQAILQHLMGSRPQSSMLWVDNCQHVASVVGLESEVDGEAACYFLGMLGDPDTQGHSLNQRLTLNRAALLKASRGDGKDKRLYRRRVAASETLLGPSAPKEIRVSLSGEGKGSEDSLVVASSGAFPSGVSFLEWGVGAERQRLTLQRGISLFGLDDQMQAQLVDFVDPCGELPTEHRFSDAVRAVAQEFAYFVFAVHDSAVCEKFDLAGLFRGLPVKDAKTLSFREPYVAIISDSEVIAERKAHGEGSLQMYVSP